MAQKPIGTSPGPIGKLSAEYNLTELHNMFGEERAQDPNLVSFNKVLDDIFQRFSHGFSGMTLGHFAEVLRAYFMVRRLVFDYFGGHPYLAAVARHAYADDIHAAALCYLANAHTLKREAPALEHSVDEDRLRALTQHLEQILSLESNSRPIDEGFARLKANLEDAIYRELSVAYRLSSGAVTTHLDLSEHLAAFVGLFTKGAQESQETRKDRDKVAEEATDRVLGAVKKALDTAKKTPPDPTPAPPAIDLDAIKAHGNRRRGRGSEPK